MANDNQWHSGYEDGWEAGFDHAVWLLRVRDAEEAKEAKEFERPLASGRLIGIQALPIANHGMRLGPCL